MKIIAGMHRSGTSLVSGLLNECGVDFGNKSKFIKPDKYNPYGYFENAEIVKLNKILIHGFFGRLSYFFYPNFYKMKKRYMKHKDNFEKLEKIFENKFVKDNRFCLTSSIWPKKIKYIILVLRHPLSIARSLKRRNKIPLFLALKIWKYHILTILKFSKRKIHLIVKYDDLLDPNTRQLEIQKICQFFYKKENIKLDSENVNKILENNFNIKQYEQVKNTLNEKEIQKYQSYINLWNSIKRYYE